MSRTLVVVVLIVVALAAVAALAWFVYRMTRRDPPGHYDAQPMHPGFRSNRGRGR